MPKNITFYYPGKYFPSLSVTGGACALECKHCNRHYLKGMKDVSSPEKLWNVALGISASGGYGFLLSGGSDISGRVNIKRFLPVIKRIKDDTNLVINFHSGVIHSREEAFEIYASGIDIVSLDFVTSDETIKNVYGTSNKYLDYTNSLKYFIETGIAVVPHITIGLHGGKIVGEYQAIDALSEFGNDVKEVVFIIFIPTRGTAYEGVPIVNPEDVDAVFRYARKKLPGKLVLGCMRPRKPEYEMSAVNNNFDGIVIPGSASRKFTESKGMEIKDVKSCCSLMAIDDVFI